MINCYTHTDESAIPLVPMSRQQFKTWNSQQPLHTQRWLQAQSFSAQSHQLALLPGNDGTLGQVIFAIDDEHDFWSLAHIVERIPEGTYKLDIQDNTLSWPLLALAWGLAHYPGHDREHTETLPARRLLLPLDFSAHEVSELVETIVWVRYLINRPANILGPEALAEEAKQLAKTYGARYKHIVGDSLLRHNFPLIHAVGRASEQAPRLVELRWGRSEHPEVVLVGKGVCFDSGGLNLKNARGMRLMKKDMGGAAHVLGLARLIMAHRLKLKLRVLLPIVENSVATNAYRPSDVLTSRKGLRVEVGNTDAEGRLILADALSFAAEDTPNLIIDFAT